MSLCSETMTRCGGEPFTSWRPIERVDSIQPTSPHRVLIIDDEKPMACLVRKRLIEAGFMVDLAADGLEGFQLAKSVPYSILILDIILSGINGLEFLGAIREAEIRTHVLILSAKGSVSDRVTALELGADDYLTKPFAFRELHARIQCLLRRSRGGHNPLSLAMSDLTLDILNQRAFRGKEEIRLQPQECHLLKYLMLNSGRVVSRTEILQHVWGYDFHPSTNLVEVHICHLREKIERPNKPRLLRTVRGVGYVLTDHHQPTG
jgi:two-component system, OmpR family, response regulator